MTRPLLDIVSPHVESSFPRAHGTWWNRLFAPVDIASLVCFRIGFGAIMLWEVWRYFDHGWIARQFITPTFHFTYYGFGWVQPWPGHGMYVHFIALGALALCIMLGLWYRIACPLFFVGFTYVFLLEQAYFLNHFYLVCLISLLLSVVPAHRALSIDVVRHPEVRSNSAPAWALWLLRAQIGIPYFYGGLAKLNGDWLRGEPMRMWLAESTNFPIIGPLFTKEWMVYLFSYGGLVLDLSIVPLLLWRRTRPIAFAAAVGFHLLNARLFRIGIFPWFMIAATTMFLAPDWPRRIARWCRMKIGAWPTRGEGHDEGSVKGQPRLPPAGTLSLGTGQRATVALLGLYLAVQLLVPLRHFLYPGNVSWTGEGVRFAWHMRLNEKKARAWFFATDPVSRATWEATPQLSLTGQRLSYMLSKPDMILQLCHAIALTLRKRGYEQIEVRAKVLVSLNGRRFQDLIDPTVNLAAQPRTLMPAPWIVPLTEPLPQNAIERERARAAGP